MQAIICKYLPATNTRSARIKATCERGSITLSYPIELSGEEAFRSVVDSLCNKFAKEDREQYGSTQCTWLKPKASGQLPSGEWVFCFIPQEAGK